MRWQLELNELLALVEANYPIEITQAKHLGGEVDTNVYIRDVDGRAFTVKTSHCVHPNDIRWQYPLLQHLRARLPGIDVPIVEVTRSGMQDVVVEDSEGYFVVRVAHWVDGRIVGDIADPPSQLLHEWGMLAANCVLALSDYPPSDVPTSHHWDVRKSAAAITQALPFVHDPKRVAAVRTVLDNGEQSLSWLESQPCQVLHQDLNDFNVLVDQRGEHVCGLLDVGDAICAPRPSEVVVAAAYAMLRQAQPEKAFAEVIEGYTRILPLSEEERKHVLGLAALRLCVNATTWTQRSAETRHEYGERRMAATWPAIEAIARHFVDSQ